MNKVNQALDGLTLILINTISKDTSLYKLYNTNIHEKIAEEKAKKQVDKESAAC